MREHVLARGACRAVKYVQWSLVSVSIGKDTWAIGFSDERILRSFPVVVSDIEHCPLHPPRPSLCPRQSFVSANIAPRRRRKRTTQKDQKEWGDHQRLMRTERARPASCHTSSSAVEKADQIITPTLPYPIS